MAFTVEQTKHAIFYRESEIILCSFGIEHTDVLLSVSVIAKSSISSSSYAVLPVQVLLVKWLEQ